MFMFTKTIKSVRWKFCWDLQELVTEGQTSKRCIEQHSSSWLSDNLDQLKYQIDFNDDI